MSKSTGSPQGTPGTSRLVDLKHDDWDKDDATGPFLAPQWKRNSAAGQAGSGADGLVSLSPASGWDPDRKADRGKPDPWRPDDRTRSGPTAPAEDKLGGHAPRGPPPPDRPRPQFPNRWREDGRAPVHHPESDRWNVNDGQARWNNDDRGHAHADERWGMGGDFGGGGMGRGRGRGMDPGGRRPMMRELERWTPGTDDILPGFPQPPRRPWDGPGDHGEGHGDRWRPGPDGPPGQHGPGEGFRPGPGLGAPGAGRRGFAAGRGRAHGPLGPHGGPFGSGQDRWGPSPSPEPKAPGEGRPEQPFAKPFARGDSTPGAPAYTPSKPPRKLAHSYTKEWLVSHFRRLTRQGLLKRPKAMDTVKRLCLAEEGQPDALDIVFGASFPPPYDINAPPAEWDPNMMLAANEKPVPNDKATADSAKAPAPSQPETQSGQSESAAANASPESPHKPSQPVASATLATSSAQSPFAAPETQNAAPTPSEGPAALVPQQPAVHDPQIPAQDALPEQLLGLDLGSTPAAQASGAPSLPPAELDSLLQSAGSRDALHHQQQQQQRQAFPQQPGMHPSLTPPHQQHFNSLEFPKVGFGSALESQSHQNQTFGSLGGMQHPQHPQQHFPMHARPQAPNHAHQQGHPHHEQGFAPPLHLPQHQQQQGREQGFNQGFGLQGLLGTAQNVPHFPAREDHAAFARADGGLPSARGQDPNLDWLGSRGQSTPAPNNQAPASSISPSLPLPSHLVQGLGSPAPGAELNALFPHLFNANKPQPIQPPIGRPSQQLMQQVGAIERAPSASAVGSEHDRAASQHHGRAPSPPAAKPVPVGKGAAGDEALQQQEAAKAAAPAVAPTPGPFEKVKKKRAKAPAAAPEAPSTANYSPPSAQPVSPEPVQPEPASRQQPETKAAPWAASRQASGSGRSLMEIQKEEADREAVRAAQAAAEAAAAIKASQQTQAQLTGWAKTAAAGVSNTGGSGLSLREIQAQEAKSRAQRAPPPIAQPSPRGSKAVWGGGGNSVAAVAGSQHMPEWMYPPDEGSADIEGSAAHAAAAREVASRQRAAAPKPSSRQPSARVGEDDDMLWDYGLHSQAAAAKPAPPPSKAHAPNGNAHARPPQPQAMAAKAPQAAMLPPRTRPVQAESRAPSSGLPNGTPADRAGSAAAAGGSNRAGQGPADAAEDADGSLGIEGVRLGPEMEEWGRAKMRVFQNSEDLTLIRWLMTLRSAGEVADYVNTYFPNHPAAPAFIAEFLRRKAAQQASAGNKRGAQRSASATSNTLASTQNDPTPAAAQAQSNTNKKGPGEWDKIPKKGPKGKNKKGTKVEGAMLGFSSGTDYSVLERDS
ncbi:hypothetical protein WJX73_000621 [Symbiochloris irregularis]|uniref:GYF domain-containing protein n=1 Tax=Symbiochloris irregularis TaxID=706552 RepID=A0AAW1NN81_9CHLO